MARSHSDSSNVNSGNNFIFPDFIQLQFEQSSEALMMIDKEGNCVDANTAACNLLGLSRQAVVGHQLTAFLEPDKTWAYQWRNEQGCLPPMMQRCRRDGSRQAIECFYLADIDAQRALIVLRDRTPDLLANAQLQGLAQAMSQHQLGGINHSTNRSSQDVPPATHLTLIHPENAESLHHQTDLWRSHQQLLTLIEQLEHPVGRLNPDGTVVDLNSAARSRLQLETLNYQGQSLQDLFSWANCHSQAQLRDAIATVQNGQAIWVEVREEPPHNRAVRFWLKPLCSKTGSVEALMLELESERNPNALALHPPHQELQSILNVFPDLFFRINADGTIMGYGAPSNADLYLPPSQFLNRSIKDIFPTAIANQMSDAIALTLDTQTVVRIEYALPVGFKEQFFEAQLVPLNGDEIVGFTHNVTNYKQIERTLLEDQQLFNGGPTVVFRWSTATGWPIEFVSPNVQTQFGYNPHELLQNQLHYQELIHPDDRARLEAEVQHYTQQGVRNFEQEYRLRHANGEYRWLYDFTTIIYRDDGSASHYLGYVLDMTKRKADEDALRRYEQIIATSTDAVAVIDRDYRYEIVNQAYLQRINLPATEVIGYSIEKVFGSCFFETVIKPKIDRCLYGETMQYEHWYDYPSIGMQFSSVTYSPYRDTDGTVSRVVAIVRNLTDLKQAVTALHQQANREKLLATITHRIRRSLNLQDILVTAVSEVRQLLQTDRVLVYRLNSPSNGVVVAESVGENWVSVLNQEIKPSCLMSHSSQSSLHGDISSIIEISTAQLADCDIHLLAQLQVQASLILPIVQNDRLWGLLVAQHCREAREWHVKEVELLQQLTDQLAIAIQQSELYQQVQQLNADLEQKVAERTAQLQQSLHVEALLTRIADKVRDSLDEQQILQTVVQELVFGLDLECCDTGVYSLDHQTSTIAQEYTRTLQSAKGSTFSLADATHPEIYPCLLKGQMVQFCEVSPQRVRLDQYQCAILACPIVDDQGVLGDLWLFKSKTRMFNDLEMRLVQQVANQCAIALRQSRLFQAAQAQVTELERLHRLKDDFLNTVSHELRTPISGMHMAIQMLELSLFQIGILGADGSASGAEYARIGQYFQILNHECQREIKLINDLLDLSRIDAMSDPLMLNPIDLKIWIPAIAESFEPQLQSHNQRLVIDIPDNLPLLISDITYLERVISELLQNACKYTPNNETITISVQLIKPLQITHPSTVLCNQIEHPSLPTPHIELCVSNSGVEIPSDELNRIFDKFYRIPNADPWKHSGTGLGLALAKKLVLHLQGEIIAQSAAGQTHLRVVLPLAPSSPWHQNSTGCTG